MSLVDATELAILGELFGGTAFAADATLYAALFTTVPADDGSGGVQANYISYARVAVTNNTTNFPSANPKLNGTAVAFPAATGSQSGQIKGLGWCTASSGGTLRSWSYLCDMLIPMAVGLATGDIVHAPGRSFTNGMLVIGWPPSGSTMPGGLTAGAEYYVISAASGNLQLSLTSGGAAINITSDGAMILARSRFTTVNNGDTPSVDISGFSLSLD